MVYPAYSELENRTPERFAAVSKLSFTLDAISYAAVSILGVLLFGELLKEDIMDNMAQRDGKLSPIIRTLFTIVLVLTLPFIFQATKLQSLVLHDEIVNRSISQKVEELARASRDKRLEASRLIASREEDAGNLNTLDINDQKMIGSADEVIVESQDGSKKSRSSDESH